MQDHQAALTGPSWEYIKPLVDNGRKRKTCLRMVVGAILLLTRTGTQWRNLDSRYRAYPPIIQYHCYRWQANGSWDRLLSSLVGFYRQAKGDSAEPPRVAVDSQGAKLPPFVQEARGFGVNKRANGRKRHIAVDTYGLPLAVAVTAANPNDGKAGVEVLWKLEGNKRLGLFCLDKGHEGEFLEALHIYGWHWKIGQKPEGHPGFTPQQGRWQAGRSSAWMNFYRRLSKDYEKTTAPAAAFIQIAFINMILAKISRLKT